MTFEAQLKYVETHFPEVWAYFHSPNAGMPKFDDNDDVVSWGVHTPQDTPQDANKKEETNHA